MGLRKIPALEPSQRQDLKQLELSASHLLSNDAAGTGVLVARLVMLRDGKPGDRDGGSTRQPTKRLLTSGETLCRDNCQLIGMPFFHTRSAGKNNRN